MIDDRQATADMSVMLKTAWNANTAAIVGIVPKLIFQGDDQDKGAVNVYWARWSQQIVIQRQATLRDGNEKRYETRGIATVQIFGPREASQSFDRTKQLAIVARNAYRGKRSPNGVSFKDCRIDELEPTVKEYRFNAVCQFWYQEAN